MSEWIELPTEEERQQHIKEHNELLKWALSLEKEKINFLMDGTFYNTAIKGYLIAAARNAKFNDEQIKDLLTGLSWAFDDIGKEEAEEIYNKWYD